MKNEGDFFSTLRADGSELRNFMHYLRHGSAELEPNPDPPLIRKRGDSQQCWQREKLNLQREKFNPHETSEIETLNST